MFGMNKIQFILFSILPSLPSFYFFKNLYKKVSFNIKFFLFKIVNERGWPFIYFCSIFRDWIPFRIQFLTLKNGLKHEIS